MPAKRIATALVVAVCTLMFTEGHQPSPSRAASEWLSNGGFEQGFAGWSLTGTTTSCWFARSGSGGLGLSLGEAGAQLSQQVAGAIIAGTFRLSGYAYVGAGQAASVTAVIQWSESASTVTQVGGGYTKWTVEAEISTPQPGVRVVLLVTSPSTATVCLDDVSLEGPFSPTGPVTPIAAPPTATATSPSSTATTSAGTPATSATASTSTPTPTPTPTKTVTPLPSFGFTNGGFEQGVSGWQTFGGDVAAVASPLRGGAAAGRFVSSTASTKWLYQAVPIDPLEAYEFSGYVMSDAGVGAAYLRVSWYASSDGSGSALESDDSTARVGGSNGSFVYLTTGGILPPAAARSARLRVMLEPSGSGTATLYLDDFSFAAGVEVPEPASEPSTGTEPDEAEPDGTPGSTAPTSSNAAPTRTPSGRTATPTPRARVATAVVGTEIEASAGSDSNLPAWPLIAVPAVVAALAGGYLYGRKRDA